MNVELLAPAGSYQTALAAIEAGADAVYMGGMKFGARAYAENGDEDTVIKAIEYVHLHGKSLYLTVNTLLKNKEMEEELYNYLLPYYTAGLDAVIVQDLGVLSFVKEHFPDLPIHASTQMTITGPESAKLLEELGCSRIVTARELSIQEIKKIRESISIEIESFIHGALCYCYSGQCLMSSMFGGRSGNRGRCAQPCRLPYQVYENQKKVNGYKNQYALSPKDMCTIEILPEIIEAGVFSLKIEGRMKKPEYTAGVVRIYRKYLDLYFDDPENYSVDKNDIQELYDLYNRDGFHTGYYKDHNGSYMMASQNLKFTEGQSKRNEDLFQKIREEYVEKQKQIPIDGVLELYKGKTAKLKIGSLVKEGSVVDSAMRQPLDRERVLKQIKKTGNTAFTFRNLDIIIDEDIFMPMQSLNELRRSALESLEKNIVSSYYRLQKPRIMEDIKVIKNIAQEYNGFSASVDSKEQLKVVINSDCIKRIYASISMFNNDLEIEIYKYITDVKTMNKECYLALPHIVRDDDIADISASFPHFIQSGLDGFLVRSLESLYLLKKLNLLSYAIIDANLYTYNNRSKRVYSELGIHFDTVPYELNYKELLHRDNGNSEMVVYGYQPLMVSAQCVKKNFSKCNKKSESMFIQDRYQKNFHVKCFCDYCYNIIYNSIPLGLLKEASQIKSLGCSGLRLNFTIENKDEVHAIIKDFYESYVLDHTITVSSERFTKGHLKRGVE